MAALRTTSRASDHGSFGGTPLCPPRRLIRCHRGSHRSGTPARQRHPPLHTCALPAPKNGATGAPLPHRMLHPSRGRYSDLCHTTVTPLSQPSHSGWCHTCLICSQLRRWRWYHTSQLVSLSLMRYNFVWPLITRSARRRVWPGAGCGLKRTEIPSKRMKNHA